MRNLINISDHFLLSILLFMASSSPKLYNDHFREDVAAQLREIGFGDVTVDHDRVVLELDSSREGALRVVAGFNEDPTGRPEWTEWLQLRIETEDRTTPLLTLAWAGAEDDALIEARIDRSLPLDRRGLNAAADIREGRYARDDALKLLRADLAAARGSAATASLRALATSRASRTDVAPFEPVSHLPPRNALDAEFAPVVPPAAARTDERIPSLPELKELLIAGVFEAMQEELLKREANLAGSGILSSAKSNVLEAIEWVMLGTAYAVDALTSRTAIASFLPGDASWLYGLVGPALIGGLGSFAKSKIDKAAALGLMASWALAVGLVTASDESYLSGAQRWFPKGEAVHAHEQTLNLAQVDLRAAGKEVTRLESKSDLSLPAALADAKSRWQAREMKQAAETEKRDASAALKAAQANLKNAAGHVEVEKTALKKAMLDDPSRSQAWRALFAIFTIINFAGPYGISRVLEKWRREHVTAKADAAAGHHARESGKLLRGSRGAQKARAMMVFTAAIDKLAQDGAPRDVLSGIDGAEIAGAAAERFDRSVNAEKFRPRLQLWGARPGS